MVQGSLPIDVERDERPHKNVRDVSKRIYVELLDSGRLTDGQDAVLTAIAEIYEETQEWPTRAELAHWMWSRKRIARPDHALIAPRITELVRGTKNRKTSEYTGCGVLEELPVRPCRIAKTVAHPWRILEAGSKFVIGS